MNGYLRRRGVGHRQAHLVHRDTRRPICGDFVWGPLDVPATARFPLCERCQAVRRKERATS